MRTEITKDVLSRAAAAFQTKGELRSCVPYGSGHINDTFRLDCEIPYILQRMNRDIFRDIPALMRNISLVTSFLREKILSRGGDPERECLNHPDKGWEKLLPGSGRGMLARLSLYRAGKQL